MSMFSKINCIVVDIDGTITDENGLLDLKALEKLRELKSKLKIKVVLASGNAYPVLMGLARYIGGIDLVVAENGAVIGFEDHIEILGDKRIGEVARRIVKEELNDILIESWQCEYRIVDYSFKRRGNIDWEYAYNKTLKIISEKLPNAKITFSGVAIHIGDKKVNKGVALKRVMEILNLDRDSVLAIGDSDVDVEMLMEAGIGVAVANASENAKKVAKIITSKSYGDGFIEIANKLIEEKLNAKNN
ncbi:MAG: phosphoglycolate phosphatase [Candidatus Methanomethylicia archaeon]